MVLKRGGKPVTQRIDGNDYYVSKTAWTDQSDDRKATQADFVDGTKVPYIAISKGYAKEFQTKPGMGFFLVQNMKTGNSVIAIYGDSRGSRAGSIELSPAALDGAHVHYGRAEVTGNQTIRITWLGNAPEKLSVHNYEPSK